MGGCGFWGGGGAELGLGFWLGFRAERVGARGRERRGEEGREWKLRPKIWFFWGCLYRERISGCGFVSFSLNLEINKERKTLFFLIIPCSFFFV